MESHSHREITEVEHSWETSVWNPLSGVKQHPAVSDTCSEDKNWKSWHETGQIAATKEGTSCVTPHFDTRHLHPAEKRVRDLHNLKWAVRCGEDFEMLNVGSCHVALIESTWASVSQADGFLCRTQGEKRHITPSCSSSTAQIRRPGLTETPSKHAGEKKQ